MKTLYNIQPKPYTRMGAQFEPKETMNEYNAQITPKKSIRIFGIFRNHVNGPQNFIKLFEIGDMAEYDSYNLHYTGKIITIGPKTVTIESYPGTRMAEKRRLDLHTFCWRNWNFDAKRIANYNAEEMMHL